MEIKLTKEESEKHFYDALCNGIGQLSLSGGMLLDYDTTSYKLSKQDLKSKNPNEDPCYEDVLMNILRRGGELKVIGGEEGHNATISIADVWSRVELTPPAHLLDAINETGDAITANSILQTVFFKEVIFG